ncbi:hypothetical protein A0O36_02196 [Piscirickettsiaceae bacterium NZ-RLO1]|nr:hypothetical protein A0O36_02196 [Piscirickettsiaceae bacterium NZ-RLO1]
MLSRGLFLFFLLLIISSCLVVSANSNSKIDVIALTVSEQVEKKIRVECNSLATDHVTDDLASKTNQDRAWQIYSSSYERCMAEALDMMRQDLLAVSIQPQLRPEIN